MGEDESVSFPDQKSFDCLEKTTYLLCLSLHEFEHCPEIFKRTVMFIRGMPVPATSVIPAKTGKGKRAVGFQETQSEVEEEVIGKTYIIYFVNLYTTPPHHFHLLRGAG